MMLEEFIDCTERLQSETPRARQPPKRTRPDKRVSPTRYKERKIKYQRKKKVYRYGKLFDTGFAEVILKDGTHHTVPDHLLIWND